MKLCFQEDAYRQKCFAHVTEVGDKEIWLDQTVFYPLGGGQPGDTGYLTFEGEKVVIVDTRKGLGHREVVHITQEGGRLPEVGTEVEGEIDWLRRYRHMRMHTALHLLCTLVPGAVTGGQITTEKGRLDFSISMASLDKKELTERLNTLIRGDYGVVSRWITDEELECRSELVRTMSVKPPTGQGWVRLIEIEGIDLQPCGGTHVARTGEIGMVEVVKIENKGKQNRRVVITLTE